MSTEGLVKVSSIVISIDGKPIELTPKQARTLRDELNELLGPKEVQVPVPFYVERPIWIDPNSERWPDHWQITCGPINCCASLSIHV